MKLEVRMVPEAKKKLRALAKHHGISMSAVVRMLVEEAYRKIALDASSCA